MEALAGTLRLRDWRPAGTIALGLCLTVCLLAARQRLIGAWYQNLGYLHLSRALLLPQGVSQELPRAEASFGQALRWQDDSSSARWGLGLAYHQRGEDGAALEEWRTRDDALSRLLVHSDVAVAAEEYTAALNWALLATELQPESSSTHYRLAEAYRGLEQPDTALREYARAKGLNSFAPGDTADMAECYFGEARLYQAQENWDTARWHYEVGVQMRRDARAYAALANIYQYRVGDLLAAASYLRQAIAMEPNQAWWHVALGEVYLSQEKYEQALSELHKALELRAGLAEEPEVLVALGRAYYGLEEFDAAAAAYETALTLDPENETAREGLDDAVGQAVR